MANKHWQDADGYGTPPIELVAEVGERVACDLTFWNYHHNPRLCEGCDLVVWPDGHDPCFGDLLPGVTNACCGHGKQHGMVQFKNGTTIRFDRCEVDGVHWIQSVDENNNRCLERRLFPADIARRAKPQE